MHLIVHMEAEWEIPIFRWANSQQQEMYKNQLSDQEYCKKLSLMSIWA